jgi:hypothetical protein
VFGFSKCGAVVFALRFARGSFNVERVRVNVYSAYSVLPSVLFRGDSDPGSFLFGAWGREVHQCGAVSRRAGGGLSFDGR